MLKVPISALAIAGEDGSSVPPAVGDTGTAEIEYTVKAVDGDMASIEPTTVGGEAVSYAEETEEPEGEGESMMKMAKMADDME